MSLKVLPSYLAVILIACQSSQGGPMLLTQTAAVLLDRPISPKEAEAIAKETEGGGLRAFIQKLHKFDPRRLERISVQAEVSIVEGTASYLIEVSGENSDKVLIRKLLHSLDLYCRFRLSGRDPGEARAKVRQEIQTRNGS